MQRLVFYNKDTRLKVRLASPQDNFDKSFTWKNKLEYIVTDNSDYTMIWTSLLPDLEPVYAAAFIELASARYPISPDYQKLAAECPQIVFQNESDEWVFFGGSFNPWHQGHQACLDLLPEDKVCLILPDRNPQKKLREIHPVSTILEISNKAKFKKLQFLAPTFLLEHKKNPTIEWVEKLKNEHPQFKISLLMGFDSFSDLKSWVRYQELLTKLHRIYVVSRREGDEERLRTLSEIIPAELKNEVIFLGRHEFEHLSSTELRKQRGP